MKFSINIIVRYLNEYGGPGQWHWSRILFLVACERRGMYETVALASFASLPNISLISVNWSEQREFLLLPVSLSLSLSVSLSFFYWDRRRDSWKAGDERPRRRDRIWSRSERFGRCCFVVRHRSNQIIVSVSQLEYSANDLRAIDPLRQHVSSILFPLVSSFFFSSNRSTWLDRHMYLIGGLYSCRENMSKGFKFQSGIG